ncbi:MAG: transposase [Thermaerobacter sp.]|nr:transposase [Thermaerobacter sp.]
MRSIREIARLHFEFGLSVRDIARSVHIGATTVQAMLVRFREQGLSWPLPPELSDTALEQLVYPREAELERISE